MNSLTEALLTILNNTEETQEFYRGREMARRAMGIAPTASEVREGTWTVEEAEVFLLADAIKDRVEDMIDDPVLVADPKFPPAVDVKGRRVKSYAHEERCDFIKTMISSAFGQIDWHAMAREILNDVKEADSYKGG